MNAPVKHHSAALSRVFAPCARYSVRAHNSAFDKISSADDIFVVNVLYGKIVVVPAAILVHCKHLSVFFGGCVHFLYFFAVESHGLFDDDVFTAGKCLDDVGLMKVVGGGYKHYFNAFVLPDFFRRVKTVQSELACERATLFAYIVNSGYLQFFGIVAVVKARNNIFPVIVPHSAVTDDSYFHKILLLLLASG